MLDLQLKNYVDWRVSQVMPVRSDFGYRIFLKYPDGSEKPQQKSGFKTEKEAENEMKSIMENKEAYVNAKRLWEYLAEE